MTIAPVTLPPGAVPGDTRAASPGPAAGSRTTVRSGKGIMPNVLCRNLQDAQNDIQKVGVFFSRSHDATGKGRRQLWDRNWIVVAQTPPPGTPIGEGDAVLDVVKKGEHNDCPL